MTWYKIAVIIFVCLGIMTCDIIIIREIRKFKNVMEELLIVFQNYAMELRNGK